MAADADVESLEDWVSVPFIFPKSVLRLELSVPAGSGAAVAASDAAEELAVVLVVDDPEPVERTAVGVVRVVLWVFFMAQASSPITTAKITNKSAYTPALP